MFEEMLALLAKPDRYVCVWRDGELYIELAERPARADEVRRNETCGSCDRCGRAKGSLAIGRRIKVFAGNHARELRNQLIAIPANSPTLCCVDSVEVEIDVNQQRAQCARVCTSSCNILVGGIVAWAADRRWRRRRCRNAGKRRGMTITERATAFGGVIDANAMTAAHRSLPQGTKIRVENTLNGRAVMVEIVDRGPFTRGRVIDVSRAAAEELGFKGRGVTRVRITSIGVSEAPLACR